MSLRVGIASLAHRSNTFVSGRTTLEDFRALGLADGGQAVIAAHGSGATAVAGALAACAAVGFEAVPLIAAEALPGPVVSSAASGYLRDRLLMRLTEAGALDGLVISLSGALVEEDVEDPETELLAAVRARVGSVPIALVLDLQANPGEGLIEEADIVIGCETCPRTDPAARGADAIGLLAAAVEGALAPVVVGRRLPLLTCPLGQATAEEPMASLLGLSRSLQARPGVARVSLLPGFPYADVERLGFAVVATGDVLAATEVAEELAAAVWAQRAEFERELVSVESAVERALAARGPVVLADVADSVGAGAPGTGTTALGALIEMGVEGAIAVLCDPVAASKAAGGGAVEIDVGDPPLTLAGRVLWTTRDAAVVRADGCEVLLTSRTGAAHAFGYLREAGIEPLERSLLLLKSAVGWRTAFVEPAPEALYLDTPGPSTCRLSSLGYERVTHPITPLDGL